MYSHGSFSGDACPPAADPERVGRGDAVGQLGALLGLPLGQRHGLPHGHVRIEVSKDFFRIFEWATIPHISASYSHFEYIWGCLDKTNNTLKLWTFRSRCGRNVGTWK